jgi:isopentenyl-diphosphate delta-isomerase
LHLINQSVPGLDWEDINLQIEFLGKQLEYPIIINALTGGTSQAQRINRVLAQISATYGIAMAVGSQTVALEDPGLRDTFTIVREENPDGVVLANISAMSTVEDALNAIDMIRADGLQLHLNIPQELAMAEGDRQFKTILANVKEIAGASPVPVIAKEVGFGLARESVLLLYNAGIKIFDVGGKGGTNFVAIEDQRDGKFGHEIDDWGIPTAVSLAEIYNLELPVKIIASGGIRTALDGAKSMALGAELIGIAGQLLRILLHDGAVELDRFMEDYLYRLKAIYLMAGAANPAAIQNQPVIILGETAEWLKARRIDPLRWARN